MINVSPAPTHSIGMYPCMFRKTVARLEMLSMLFYIKKDKNELTCILKLFQFYYYYYSS